MEPELRLEGRPDHGFPYDNSLDAFASVTCTDSSEKTKSSQYPTFAVQADKKALLRPGVALGELGVRR